ncbi:Smr/MutS family protein [Helicobacter canis]|uniref:Endonuclease MutS2 n=1 Tax=Helicobacter canis NCTC 12740 TaxID=1357399 RepID=V8CK72_9HELI|nr:Smr/MutS family protein [Helicobacter canis]ETD27151.1 hypothetical protein HMPREF2087_00059 [Helicobacter canis NCTC 12740]
MLVSKADLQLVSSLDLDDFLTHFSTYLARPKPIYLQGDKNLYHTMLREMDSMSLPALPALGDFSHAFLLLQKRGTLSLQDIWGFARELEFFISLQNALAPLPESKLHALVAKIAIPAHLLEALCIFDEKGEIEAGRFVHIDNLRAQLSSTQSSIKQTLNALLARESLAPYLVDKQIHLLYDAQTLLLKAGYSRVLKGSVLERTQGGFFYVLPNEIARFYDKLQELRDLYALEIQKLCATLSETMLGELRFLRFLDRQFDLVDLLCARVGFAKDLGLEFVATRDCALGSQGRVGFWAKNGSPQQSTILAQNKQGAVFLEKPTPETKKAQFSSKVIILHSFCHPILKNPKPISLTFDKGLLLLTGVNAGGKTMLLKSILSAAFLAKLLLPMKINPHASKIPYFKHIYAIISNPQNPKDDISTFAGRVLEFSQQLDKEDLLLGIDEIELGTDADEAASLYKVLLELLLDRHSKLVVTTHHKRLAALMAKDPRIQLAAAMFDVEKSSATYTFLHGSIGKSYAFEIAQKFGIPKHIIARAKEHYGSDKERLNALIEHSSNLSLELESKAQELQKRIQKARNAKEAYSEKIYELEQAYKARERELESTYNKALQALKAQANTQKDIHRNLNQAHEILRHKPKLDSSFKQSQVRKEFRAGDLARYGEQSVRIVRTQKEHCVIELDSGMRLKVEKSALAPLSKALASTLTNARNAAKTTLSYTPKAHIKLDLHGLRAEEALEKLGDFISDSLIAGFDEVLIFHGIGTGVLSAVVKDFLQNHPKVISFSDAPPNMGGYGAKLVRL